MSARLHMLSSAACLLAAASAFGQAPTAASPFEQDPRPIEETNRPPLSFGALADLVMPSTVSIRIPGNTGRPDGSLLPAGSGVIISADGHILTTSRVVGNARAVDVSLSGESAVRVLPGQVLVSDPASDVALVKVDGPRLPLLPLADSNLVRTQTAAFFPEAARAFAKVKITSAGGSGRGRAGDFIETDTPVSMLNAGSPLVDSLGRVIGLNVPSPRGQAMGLAIPINAALPLLESLSQPPPATVAAVPRAFLGVQIADLPPVATPPGVPPVPRGAVVQMIGAGSPAERAGLEIGDVIVTVDNQPVSEGARLRQILSGRPPGAEVAIEVLREGRPLTLKAVLAEIPTGAASVPSDPSLRPGDPSAVVPSVPRPSLPPDDPAAVVPPVTPMPVPADITPAEMLAGLTTVALTPEMRARHAIPAEVSGVFVTSLSPTSRAVAMGVQEGDVIMQVNRKPVTSAAEARNFALQGDKTVLLKIYRKGDTMVFMVGRE